MCRSDPPRGSRHPVCERGWERVVALAIHRWLVPHRQRPATEAVPSVGFALDLDRCHASCASTPSGQQWHAGALSRVVGRTRRGTPLPHNAPRLAPLLRSKHATARPTSVSAGGFRSSPYGVAESFPRRRRLSSAGRYHRCGRLCPPARPRSGKRPRAGS